MFSFFGTKETEQVALLCLLFFWKLNNLFLNLSCLTDSVTKIIELASADFTVSDSLNLSNVGRMNGENPLYAYAVGNASYGESLADSAALDSDNRAFKDLNSFSFAFTDLDMNLNGFTDLDIGYLGLETCV